MKINLFIPVLYPQAARSLISIYRVLKMTMTRLRGGLFFIFRIPAGVKWEQLIPSTLSMYFLPTVRIVPEGILSSQRHFIVPSNVATTLTSTIILLKIFIPRSADSSSTKFDLTFTTYPPQFMWRLSESWC